MSSNSSEVDGLPVGTEDPTSTVATSTVSVVGVCLVNENQPTDPVSICAATMYILFGIVYTLFGYRCFKAVMFLTGFIFASVIVYLICIQEKLLPSYANTGIAICAGLLFGLITMLVQYVGLFMTGFHTGLFVAFATLALVAQFYQPQSLLTSITALLGSGLLFAILNLQWQKSLTIFGTSVYGGALVSGSVDYLVEGFRSAHWFWRYKSLTPCYPVVLLWPSMLALGLAVQICFTAPVSHHSDKICCANNRGLGCCLKRNGSLSSSNDGEENDVFIDGRKGKHGVRPRTREQRAELRQNKYRYLYQVRTAHGDVISQNYVQALQNKVVGPGETSTLESDATHLTMLPDGQPDLGRSVNYYR